MQRISKLSTIIATCALLSTPVLAQGGNGNGGNGGQGGQGGNGVIMAYIDTLPLEQIDAVELADLDHMRQEEKLARDTYLMLYGSSGLNIFNNIAQAEQSHMDLTLAIYNRYGLIDPLLSDDIGVFPDPAFTTLFRRMVTFGRQSNLHALWIGAIIEDLDIYDLDGALARTDNRDIAVVWQNLARGSRNHMRAFYGQLQNLGVTYMGIWLPNWRILDIVNTPVENQPVDENGVVLP